MLVTAEKSTIAKPFLKWAEGKTSLKSATGENQNPFYQTPRIKEPIISNKATLKDVKLKNTFVYDFETKPGGKYILSEVI
jgi:alpha-L-fucosidase 2